ncbi:MAG: rRNA pseudouridine synthase [Spirochaetes bacterium]|nr:rRNA pseudouridine synthase [Spirochaetota bacterium]
MKLWKFLVDAQVGSRRHCFDLILKGQVSVNNTVNERPLSEIDPQKDVINIEDKKVKPVKGVFDPVYIMMNKPSGVICSRKDEKGRFTLYDLIKHKNLSKKHLIYAGRLDYKTEGLIFLTNDGDFVNLLTHPRYNVLKYYYVEIKGSLEDRDVKRMTRGISSENVLYKVKEVKILSRAPRSTRMIIVLNEGKNREIRNIFLILRYKVKYLKRIQMGPFKLDGKLEPGEYKLVSKKEIQKFMNRFQ